MKQFLCVRGPLCRLAAVLCVFGTVSFKLHVEDPEDDFEIDEFGHFADLAVSFPLVITNLSNFSGLINGRLAPRSETITTQFGNLTHDMEMLYDKVDGFYTVLHASMSAQDGPKYCPRHDMKHIKECLIIASCILQSQVPEYIEMAMYASYMEMMDRFVEISWPILNKALLEESATTNFEPDHELPNKYICDDLGHPDTFNGNLLQVQASNALGMSAVLGHASAESQKFLDAHMHNGSLEHTAEKLIETWKPVCQKLGCDHGNFWDAHYASHRQTMALMQTGQAAVMRREIRQRLSLERRVQRFMQENRPAFAAFLASEKSTSAGRFFDFRERTELATGSFHEYGKMGKSAMIRFVVPYTRVLAMENETRATQSFDLVEYRKFKADRERKEGLAVEMPRPAPVAGSHKRTEGRALLSMREEDEEEEEEEEEAGRRRRKKKGGFGKKVGKSIKKTAKKAGKGIAKAAKAVAKATVTVVEFLTELFACIGDVFEFVLTGYSKDVVPGISFAIGLTVGDMLGVLDLLNGKPPSTWVSIDVGFSTGTNTPASWTGFGIGAGVSCGASGCFGYFSVGAMVTVNLPAINPITCPFGPWAGGFECEQVFGGGISAFCCNVNVITGQNDCR